MNESSNTSFVLAESVGRDSFEDDIYAHLSALAAIEFSRPGSPAQSGTFRLNASKYQALEQAAFEEAPRMEAEAPQPVNWSDVDGRISIFEKILAASISSVRHTGDPTPFIEFSAKCYENWLAYQGMYPNSNGSNPWARTMRVLRFGRLIAIDDQSRLERARRAGSMSSDVAPAFDASNVSVLVKGAPQRPAMMHVDERFALQARVLAFLKTDARGHANRVSLRVIKEKLASTMGTRMSEQQIQIKLTVPLKKAGVIGSTSKGFFFIDSEDDLIASYCFHRTKVMSADKIMDRYRARAREMDPELSLEAECNRSGRVLNRDL